ncbi:MAG: class I SAM-dependent methyltransferase [Planctomycetes bacterium]|nr:class I SAM-dependent methyltransferase [Planctomycetota bacterium]
MSARTETFDAAYYDRYYRNRRTRVTSPATVAKLARFVTAYLDAIDVSVRTVADLGCGLGWWRDALAELVPKLDYRGVEFSDYLVEQCGWEHGSVVDWDSDRTFDLVICQGVLQYLPNADAARALDNLSELTHGALYLEVLTKADWQQNVDRDRTDGKVWLRTARWYRQRLRPHFFECGGGVFVRRDSGISLFELEHFG